MELVGKQLWGHDESLVEFQTPEEVGAFLGCTAITARLLWSRGYRNRRDLETVVRPKLSDLPSPFVIVDLEKAADRIVDAIANEEKIAVYGDYDVDGTCGAAILSEFLCELGATVVTYQPNRFTEGYGVNTPAVEKLVGEGATVLITVDCGITAVAQAKLAQENGCDFIVVDHHLPGPGLPDAFAVVDPQRADDHSGLQNLCGAGLAFFLIMGLRSKLREAGFFEDREEPTLLKYLDLVATATIADMADIRGVNRILVSFGMKVMNKNPRPGLKAILEGAAIKELKSSHLGFVVGPRINAAGRLSSAQSALRLLTCTDATEAKALAQKLEEINAARRETQDEVLKEARAQAQTLIADERWARLAKETPAASLGPWPRALVLADEHWHEGVLGIVASKIVEEFGRPTFILAKKENADDSAPVVLKGSARSFGKIDIFSVMQAPMVSEQLLNFGGHAHAGGASLLAENLDKFRDALNSYLAVTTTEEHFRREKRFDLELREDDLSPRILGSLTQELETLEPFGMGFPEPVFKVTACKPKEARILKERHLKLKLGSLEALWFFSVDAATQTADEFLSKPMSVWVSPQWNEWQGQKRLQLRISHAEF